MFIATEASEIAESTSRHAGSAEVAPIVSLGPPKRWRRGMPLQIKTVSGPTDWGPVAAHCA